MKKFMLTALALSLLTAPTAMAKGIAYYKMDPCLFKCM